MPPRAPRSARRRRFRRRTVRVLVDFRTAGGVRCEYATTLGAGGMFVSTEEPLPAGETLKVRFRLPGSERVHEIEARVVWAERPDVADTPRPPGMGLAFTDAAATAVLARELERPDPGEPEETA